MQKLEALREFKTPPRIFKFYSWLSIGIARVNKELFQKFLCPDPETLDLHLDTDRHQNLIDCSLDYALLGLPPKIHQNPFITY